ncbi:MAG: mechanosensitive ion channel [Promethearchaeota archaeon]|nr:MAG: mechanosensitive ion channel [Candidatus Lokiarchaeota archaeon]
MSFTNSFYLDLIIVGIGLFATLVIYKIITTIVKRRKKISEKRKLIIKFSLRFMSILIILYLLLGGLSIFEILEAFYPGFSAIIASSISIAIAFASSGIFENLISGIILIILNPFEIEDIVSIGDAFGAVRELKITKTVIETFDNIFIEISNADVISAKIVKYSLKLENIKHFLQFKERIHQAEQEGFPPIKEGDLKEQEEIHLRNVFEAAFKRKENPKIHNFTFSMEFHFAQFRKKIEYIEQLFDEYEEKFGFRPRYHIFGMDNFIKVRFRLITFDSNNFFKYQPEFAKKVYQIVQK